MTQNPTILPPVQIAPVVTPPEMVGIHFGPPCSLVVFEKLIPQDFPLAAWLVARILTLALTQDALLENDQVFIMGTLGDGISEIPTRHARQTVQIIKAEMQKLLLQPLCQIGIRTAGQWLCVWPGPEFDLAPLMDKSRVQPTQQAFLKLLKQHADTLGQAVQKYLNRPPGDCPPTSQK
jgi:hypothetical protein